MARPKKQEASKNQFLELYPKLRGNISVICIACKISRRTFYNWMKDDKEFRQEIEDIDIDELKLDLAEHQLDNLIKNQHWGATKFFLEKKGAKRGYGDDNELTIKAKGNAKERMEIVLRSEIDPDDIGYIDT